MNRLDETIDALTYFKSGNNSKHLDYAIRVLKSWKNLIEAYNHEECDQIPEYIRDKFLSELKNLEE